MWGPHWLRRLLLPQPATRGAGVAREAADHLLSASLSLDGRTLRPAGGGSAPAVEDGGGVASPGAPPACTCATLAFLRTTQVCGGPGALPQGDPRMGPSAACTPPPPAFSRASRGPRETPSRPLRAHDANPGWQGQAATDPNPPAPPRRGPALSTSHTLTPSPRGPVTLGPSTSGSPRLPQGPEALLRLARPCG